ncbi:hypothetical protein GGTG_13900, partial [Gaeumannomyces tritici R3-111a-1]
MRFATTTTRVKVVDFTLYGGPEQPVDLAPPGGEQAALGRGADGGHARPLEGGEAPPHDAAA